MLSDFRQTIVRGISFEKACEERIPKSWLERIRGDWTEFEEARESGRGFRLRKWKNM